MGKTQDAWNESGEPQKLQSMGWKEMYLKEDWWAIWLGVGIDHVVSRRRQRHGVYTRFRGQTGKIIAIKTYFIKMGIVRIPGFFGIGHKIDHPILLIDLYQLRNYPISLRNLVPQLTRVAVVEI